MTTGRLLCVFLSRAHETQARTENRPRYKKDLSDCILLTLFYSEYLLGQKAMRFFMRLNYI